MAIYKLGEICDIVNGSKVLTKTGHIPVVGSGGVFGYTSISKTTEHSIALPRKGTMIIQYYPNPVWNVDTTYLATNTDKDKVDIKYLYYRLLNSDWKGLISGSTRPAMTKTEWSNFELCIPDLSLQQEIIDIIEPIEKCISNVKNQIKILKNILVNQYEKNTVEYVSFIDFIELHSSKFSNQKEYLATNAISEFGIDYDKVQNVEEKRPSRANLSPKSNSLIISKLDGENKVFYVDKSFSYVVSTGFFNFTTDYLDHVTGFILSESFKKQKTTLSTGTTMVGLSNESLLKIKMNKPINSNNTYTLKLNRLLKVEKELNTTLSILVKLLIK